MSTFSEELKRIRLEKGMTQKEVAEKMGIARGAYSQYESGNRNPKWDTIVKLASSLSVDASELLELLMLSNTDPQQEEVIQKTVNEYYLHVPSESPYSFERNAETLRDILMDLTNEAQEKVIEYAFDLSHIDKYRESKYDTYYLDEMISYLQDRLSETIPEETRSNLELFLSELKKKCDNESKKDNRNQ